MASIELTKDNFAATIENNDIIFVDFWAAWCGPCRAFAPVFEAASEKYPDIVFGKVDTEAQRELAATFQIRSIPTLMVFRENILLFQQPGALPSSAFEELIGKIMELDMDDIRRQIAEQQAKEEQGGE